MSALFDEIQEHAGHATPRACSAVMPALQLAQERNGGWLSEQAFRDVADALDLTPAYCLSIASFYDMFRLEPVGEHVIEVCTNISCGLNGAQQVVEAFESELGVGGRRRRRRRSRCAPSSASAAAAGRRSWRSTTATACTCRQTTCRRIVAELRGVVAGGGRMPTSTPEIVFAGTNGGALTEIADYEAVGGFTALAKARALTPDEVIEELNASNLRGRGGAFFPTGRKWSFVPKPDKIPKPHYLVINADESEPGTFKDREIMLRVPFRFLEGSLIAAHAIESTHVFIYIRGEYEAEFEVLVAALEQMRARKPARRRHDRRPPRRRRLHLRRGDGAARVARGQARPAAHEAAVPGDRRPLCLADRRQQRRVDHHRHVGARDRRRRVREARRRELDGHARLLALRQRRQRRQLRAAARLPAASDLIDDIGGGVARRPHAEGRDPGWLVDRDPDRRRGTSASRSTSTRSSAPARRSARRR